MRPPQYLILDLIVGSALAVFVILYTRRFPASRERRFYAVGLGVAAFIYLIFGMRAGSMGWLGIETAGVVLYGLLAWLGLVRSPWFLVAGWLLHVAWDVGLHATALFVPAPYPGWCLAFDVIVAAYLAVRRKRWAVRRPPSPGASAPGRAPAPPPA